MKRRTRLLGAGAVALLVLTAAGLAAPVLTSSSPPGAAGSSGDGPPDAGGPPEDIGDDGETDSENETIETINGTFKRADDGSYRLAGLRISIGPPSYVADTDAPADFDGDGTVEMIRAEFDGLVGQNVTMTVKVDGETGSVRSVNGQQYITQDPPPWADVPAEVRGSNETDESDG